MKDPFSYFDSEEKSFTLFDPCITFHFEQIEYNPIDLGEQETVPVST
jgi:hypothetical protein